MHRKPLICIMCTASVLIGCSAPQEKNGTPSVFNTRVEAENAANEFNCTGAHKMGKKWMPCKKHSNHHNH